RPPPTRSARSCGSGSRPTSTPAWSSWSTPSPRAPPARSSSGRSRSTPDHGARTRRGTRYTGSLPRPGSADEAVFVGEDGDLHPVAQSELAQDRAHVGLDRGLAGVDARGDLRVAQAPRDGVEDLALLLRELLELLGQGRACPV